MRRLGEGTVSREEEGVVCCLYGLGEGVRFNVQGGPMEGAV